MSSFTEILIVSPLNNGKDWVVRKEFDYEIGHKGSSRDYSGNFLKEIPENRVSVPAGFVTDFCSSIPIVWSVIPKWDKYGKATVIHDYLYFTREVSRKKADDIFYEAMLVLGVKKWKAKMMYWSVRLFGRKSYKKSDCYIIEPLDGYVKVSRMKKDWS